ncbi:MAG TPA: hypothetical protein VMR52_14285 [Dehalococcoidia bacterium]|nr:hypothetical protein [Dehalococcoidia bacterium]
MRALNMNRAFALAAVVAALVVAVSFLATGGEARASDPEVTDDIVLLGDDAFVNGDAAEFTMRNDGDVAYLYQKYQPQCGLIYRDASQRMFQIPSAVHCDLPEQAEIAPGETVTVFNGWKLDECTLTGFFCMDIRPLSSGDYTISGSLLSADGTKRAEFSKTVSITGPTFTDDITAAFGVIVSDPPTGLQPLFLTLFNSSSIAYTLPQPGCYLRFRMPDGLHFVPNPPLPCDGVTESTLAPDGRVDVMSGWMLDACTEFGLNNTCAVARPLPPGVYTVDGAVWSEDGGSYSEFSASYTIQTPAATPSPTPQPSPGDFPRTGGEAGGGHGGPDVVLTGLAFAVFGALTAILAARNASRRERSDAVSGLSAPGS